MMGFRDGIFRFKEWYIPGRMMKGIERYVEERILPGDFLQAIICNDLKETIGRADDENLRNIPAYVAFFYNETPATCWGSEIKMNNWLDQKEQS